jgi:excisionase family DNA binding protein
MTQKQAAHLLGVSRFTIRNMTLEGQLHPVQVRECWRYRRNEIEDLAAGKRGV